MWIYVLKLNEPFADQKSGGKIQASWGGLVRSNALVKMSEQSTPEDNAAYLVIPKLEAKNLSENAGAVSIFTIGQNLRLFFGGKNFIEAHAVI